MNATMTTSNATTTSMLETALGAARMDRDAMYDELTRAESRGIGGLYLLDRRLAYGAAAQRCRRLVEKLADADRATVRAALAKAGD